METIVRVSLNEVEIRALQAVTHRRNPTAAVAATVKAAVERARLSERYPRPHKPNAVTARALRSKKSGRVFTRAADAISYLKAL